MFPINKRLTRRFRTEGNPYYEKLRKVLDSNSKEIIHACQEYLSSYEELGRPQYAVDIDLALTIR